MKKMMNVLLINQLLIDFYTCLMIVATYGVNLADIYLSGTSGYALCLILSGEQLMWIGLNSSAVNIVVITVERYIKVVHSIWHKNNFKRWMVYFGCAFSWASGFFGNLFPFIFATYVSDGQCMPVMQFPSQSAQMAYIWFTYLYYFQLPLVMFVICYARIFQVIRRQNRIFQQTPKDTTAVTSSSSSAAAAATAANRKSWRSQVNAVKTMSFITVFFAVSWLPNYVYFVVQATTNSTPIWSLWYATVLVALFNVCANPFIYIVSYDDIRVSLYRKLADTFLMKMFRGQAVGNNSILFTLSEHVQTAMATR
jgi:hypothetical protein